MPPKISPLRNKTITKNITICIVFEPCTKQPIQFTSMRAWFSTRPKGVDLEFRQGTKSSNHSNSSIDDIIMNTINTTNCEHGRRGNPWEYPKC